MGANAVTTVPVYVAGEVLTAADLNITNSGIPVFATSVERDAAFGGTGEKVLAEGQFAYIEATNTTQYYDGAAWQSVGTTPGLAFISAASFTAASTVSLPTNTFTATYRNYRVIYEITSGSTDIVITGRLRAAGSDLTGANYNFGAFGLKNDATNNLFADVNATSSKLGFGISGTGVNQASMIIDFIAPQLSDKTLYSLSAYYQDGPTTPASMNNGGGVYNVATAADSFTLICSTGNITGVYRVYGYSES